MISWQGCATETLYQKIIVHEIIFCNTGRDFDFIFKSFFSYSTINKMGLNNVKNVKDILQLFSISLFSSSLLVDQSSPWYDARSPSFEYYQVLHLFGKLSQWFVYHLIFLTAILSDNFYMRVGTINSCVSLALI